MTVVAFPLCCFLRFQVALFGEQFPPFSSACVLTSCCFDSNRDKGTLSPTHPQGASSCLQIRTPDNRHVAHRRSWKASGHGHSGSPLQGALGVRCKRPEERNNNRPAWPTWRMSNIFDRKTSDVSKGQSDIELVFSEFPSA